MLRTKLNVWKQVSKQIKYLLLFLLEQELIHMYMYLRTV